MAAERKSLETADDFLDVPATVLARGYIMDAAQTNVPTSHVGFVRVGLAIAAALLAIAERMPSRDHSES